jgi:hypothetical protein
MQQAYDLWRARQKLSIRRQHRQAAGAAAAESRLRMGELIVNDDPFREFEDALTDVLTETAYSLSRRTRLANARAAVDQNDPRYIEAVNRAFLMTLNQGPRQMG